MQTTKRLTTLDGLRGFIILVMALDHANYFVARKHAMPEFWAYVFSEHTSILSFLTRLVTHLAAPGFFFLMGVGMWLFAQKRTAQGWSKTKIMTHFAIRGGILVALQFLLENPAWRLAGSWPEVPYYGVLFGLGSTMIVAAFFLWLPAIVSGIIGIVIVVGSWLAIVFTDQALALASPPSLQNLLYVPTIESNVFYPVLPWLALVLFGMSFAQRLQKEGAEKTFRAALYTGSSLLFVFVFLRWIGQFGNTRPPVSMRWMDFLNLVKYPPSITFLLLTMGVNLILLWGLSKINASILGVLTVFGRVPLFFYLTHLYLYGLIGRFFFPHGSSFPVMYGVWLLGLLILFPLCLWYGRFKQNQSANSVLRFL